MSAAVYAAQKHESWESIENNLEGTLNDATLDWNVFRTQIPQATEFALKNAKYHVEVSEGYYAVVQGVSYGLYSLGWALGLAANLASGKDGSAE